MPTVAEAFAVALQQHQAGNVAQAEQLYRQILQADPAHADAHHLLGVAQYQAGRHSEAATSIRQAVALNEWAGIYHSNLAVVYEAMGRQAEALASFEHAVRLQPMSPEAHNGLGNSLRAAGRFDEAVEQCIQALRLRRDFPEAHDNLGNAYYMQQKLDQAMVHYREAIRLKPDYALSHGHLALALADKGVSVEARAHYEEALRLNPKSAEAHNNYSILLLRENQLEDAAAHCEQALAVDPYFSGAHNNLGIALRRLGRLDEAVAHCRQAVTIQPEFPEARNSLGTALLRQANYEEALFHYDEAVRQKSQFSEARWNRALLWLALGDYEKGWPEYEWRWTQPGHTRRHFEQPAWDGSDLSGRTILIYTEQGLGDTLHMIRYAPVVKSLGSNVIVECQPSLFQLLGGVPGIDELMPAGKALPPFDVQAALFTLPAILHTTLKTIPNEVPYLHADAVLVEKWQQELRPDTDKREFLVGINWQGSPTYGYDNLRSIPLEHFACLAGVEGVRLVSLQKRAGIEQLHEFQQSISIIDFSDRLDETAGAFMDTAAIMMNLDLVISTDTAVPHLAGALGVPVWLATPYVPDWRWLLDREESPWYPTMRLFRQSRQGDWDDVFHRMAAELKQTISLTFHP